jgi:hypothetical protein
MGTITFSTILTTVNCAACGILFAMPVDYQQRRRDDHERFHCPVGHWNYYLAQSEAERLRDELAREKHRTDQATARADDEARRRRLVIQEKDAVERSLRATKAVVTRTKKKIVAGRCPCCSHKFKDLAVHMTTKHPDYDPDRAIAAIEAKA